MKQQRYYLCGLFLCLIYQSNRSYVVHELPGMEDVATYETEIQTLHHQLSIDPYAWHYYFELGVAYTRLGRCAEAVAAYTKILEYRPNFPQALYNMGYAYKMCGNQDAAIACYEKIIATCPTYKPVYFALSRAYLQKGDFKRGWQESEAYFKESGKYAPALRSLICSNTVHNKRILLRPEGGLGDTLHFIRYARTLHEMGAHITLLVQPELISLLSLCPYIDELIPLGTTLKYTYDADATLMSLPAIFNDDVCSLPHQPYLYADPTLVHAWAAALPTDHNLRVGICWQASAHNDVSRSPVARRSIPLELLSTLGELPGISLYSLQQKEGLEQLKKIPSDRVYTFDASFDTQHGAFMDTAAVMHHLDLIITVDTALAHLAGGLGRPVWILLPFETDWRWISGHTNSPWYPSMTIFRQGSPFDWLSLINIVALALRQIT